VYVYSGTFTKTGGTITGYADDPANGNVVKDSSGNILSNYGHAVYASYYATRRKETTAGPDANLYYSGSSYSYSGAWDYTVTFYANSGDGTPPDALTGTTITLPDGSGLSRSGYTFGGWTDNYDSANYQPGDSFTPSGDTDLYARWNVIPTGYVTLTITYKDIVDAAPSITGPTLYRVRNNGPTSAVLTVDNPDQYDSISWQVENTTAVGTGSTFTLNASNTAYNRVGEHFVTVVVSKNGVPYNKTVSFRVEY
jgi:uncharacterized repeat protein (TIGR02543 family)